MSENTCSVSRWDLLKSQLNNLEPEVFLKKAIKKSNAILLDVRTASEYGSGTIVGAKNMDYLGDQFWDQFEALPKDSALFVFCRTGRRSARVCTLMRNAGFTEVYNMEGGLTAQQALGTTVTA